MPQFDSQRIVTESFIDYVEYHPMLDSTNALAFELRRELQQRAPALVLTDQQTAGRGRGDHSWWSAGGALTCTVLLDADRHGPAAGDRPLVALATGLAVHRLISQLLPQHDVWTKWPNDVLVGDRKICGILCEQHAVADGSALIVGIGINVNNSMAQAPADVQQRATSVFDLDGRSHSLTVVAIELLNQLQSVLDQLREDTSSTLHAFSQAHRLTGRHVTIETPTERVDGHCQGLADDGALLLSTDNGIREIHAGTVLAFD